jgi:hypothetical protein
MPHVALVPFTGFRVREADMLALGMTLPGLADRAAAVAQLPALGLLTLARIPEVLAAGEVPKDPRPAGRRPYRVQDMDMYRLTDVKVGDWVRIIYARVDGVDTCDHIKIIKRPGGRVPPLPKGVKEVSVVPYHERMNAYWDLEDKGIPYPESFATRGFPRRWPEAPPPREVSIPQPRDNHGLHCIARAMRHSNETSAHAGNPGSVDVPGRGLIRECGSFGRHDTR